MGSKQPEGIKNLLVAFFISAPIFSSIKSRIPCAVGVAIRCEQNRGEFTTSTLLLLDFRLTGSLSSNRSKRAIFFSVACLLAVLLLMSHSRSMGERVIILR